MTDSLIFSKMDADRILRRAAEIERSEDAKPLTVMELRSIAEEAGFGLQAVERAIAEARRAAFTEIRRPPVEKSGLAIVDLSTHRTIPVEVTTEQLMKAVRLLHPYRDGPAQVKLEEHQITWRDRKGIGFTVTSSGGVTEISVFVSKLLIRRGRWIEWVKYAADRLETLVFMVAAQLPPDSALLGEPPEPPGPGSDPQPRPWTR
jgi:hypothetical protein